MKKLKSIYAISLALIMLFSVYQTRAIMTEVPSTEEPGSSVECSQNTEPQDQDNNDNLVSTPSEEENNDSTPGMEAVTIREIDEAIVIGGIVGNGIVGSESHSSADSIEIDKNTRPTIEIEKDEFSVAENQKITLEATPFDAENDPVSCEWTIPKGIETTPTTECSITIIPPNVNGDEKFNLSVKAVDIKHKQSSDAKNIILHVINENAKPIININTNVSVSENQNITLIAITSDTDNDPVSCEWTIPRGIVTTNTHECSITITAPTVNNDTIYELSVRAFDTHEFSDIKNVVLGVLNIAEPEQPIGGGNSGNSMILPVGNSMSLPTPPNQNNIITPSITPQVLGEKISSESDNTNKVETKNECFRFTRRLRTGYRDNKNNTEVSALQRILKNFGLFKYPTITGYFGPITRQALREFQKSKGLDQVGYIGPKTLQALNECN